LPEAGNGTPPSEVATLSGKPNPTSPAAGEQRIAFADLLKAQPNPNAPEITFGTAEASRADSAGDMILLAEASREAGPGSPSAPAGGPVIRATPLPLLALEIGMQAVRGNTQFTLKLDPEDLGSVEIRLDIARNGEVSAHCIAERTETLNLLRREAQNLQQALEQAGLKTSSEGLGFSLRGEGESPREGREAPRQRQDGSEDAPAAPPEPQMLRRILVQQSQLDRLI
jgi:hypothetical protein